MKRTFYGVLLGLILALPACADEQAEEGVAPIKVDIAAVVGSGVVQPVDGISAAGQPSEAALSVFAKSGYVAVIDLRTEGENRGFDEAGVVEELGMEYVPMPIASADDINFGNAQKLDQLIKSYEGPVLVHCASSNRVGALLALADYDNNGDKEMALAKGKAAGMTGLEGRVKEVLDSE
jgi:uncharacterized protein (TIGR01244 family)